MNVDFDTRGTMKDPNCQTAPGMYKFSASALLSALAIVLISAPFLRLCPGGAFIETVLVTVMLLSVVLAVGGRRKALFVAAVLAAPAVAVRWINYGGSGSVAPGMVVASAIPPISFAVAMLFRFVLKARRVDSEVICAAVSNYLLLGLLWSFAYSLVEKLAPGSFSCGGLSSAKTGIDQFTFLYFSLVTLATVGFGDIYPLADAARMLAVIEGITGTFYMAILIARLVAAYSLQAPSNESQNAPGPDRPAEPISPSSGPASSTPPASPGSVA